MRRAGKIDANHAAIVDALRKIGASVQSLASMGGGVPDLLVGWRGINVLFEVKDGSKPPSARALTVAEADWHAKRAGRVVVVESAEQAQTALIDSWGRTQ